MDQPPAPYDVMVKRAGRMNLNVSKVAMPPVNKGHGGRRAGAGRPRTRPIPAVVKAIVLKEAMAAASPEVLRALDEICAVLQRLVQQQRDERESGPAILRRLVELEHLVRGDDGLAKPSRHTRRRPLG